MGHHLFVPKPEDKLAETAFKQIADAYPECECHPIWECDNIIREGGALNCCTWNVLSDLSEKENNNELQNTK